jgi:hypothetical protein
MQGYLNGTLASLTSYILTLTTNSTTLVETSIVSSSLSNCDRFF